MSSFQTTHNFINTFRIFKSNKDDVVFIAIKCNTCGKYYENIPYYISFYNKILPPSPRRNTVVWQHRCSHCKRSLPIKYRDMEKTRLWRRPTHGPTRAQIAEAKKMAELPQAMRWMIIGERKHRLKEKRKRKK